MIRAARRLALLAVFSAGCSSSTDVTAVRLAVVADDDWSLDALELTVGDRHERLPAAAELLVLVPDDWAGTPHLIEVDGFRADASWAHGEVEVTPRADGEISATVVLARLPCGAWCTPGATTCVGDAVVVCEQRDDDACMEWSEPIACSDDAPYCSLGTCRADCIDECSADERRCDGPGALRVCGEADSDPCQDWVPAIACPDGESCSNGACSDTCHDECEPGDVACQATGLHACGDLNLDDCQEWGPVTPCTGSATCSNDACSTECTDECSASECTGLQARECGSFDLDPCADLSPGVSCLSDDACVIGACSAAGCTSAPVVCDEPPASECVAADLLRVYDAGVCADGACDYAAHDIACPSCPACDPCDEVTCDEPPDAECISQTTLRTYGDAGTCTDGSCAYPHVDTTCGHGCLDGHCRTSRADFISTTTCCGADTLVGLSTGASFGALTLWSGTGSDDAVDFADVDGDGRADLIYNYPSPHTMVGLSTGISFGPLVQWAVDSYFRPDFADVNGDGRADFISTSSLGGADTLVGLSTGASFGELTLWSGTGSDDAVDFADVNGDGRADLIYNYPSPETMVGLSTGTSFATLQPWAADSYFAPHFADVNGDGRADLISTASCCGADTYVSLSTGTSFGDLTLWSGTGSDDAVDFADVDGDGRADLIYNYPSPHTMVGLSTGTSFGALVQWAAESYFAPRFADVDGQ